LLRASGSQRPVILAAEYVGHAEGSRVRFLSATDLHAASDLNVSLAGGQLWISGERKGAPDADDRSFYVRERRYAPFRRIITLPETAVGDRITATVEDGLLEIVVEGGAVADDHEQIEIAGAEPTEVRLDVAGDG
jgi:hypothetical protein